MIKFKFSVDDFFYQAARGPSADQFMLNQGLIVELDPLSEVGFSIIVCHKSNRFYPFHRKASRLIQASTAADLSSRILSEKGMISQIQYMISPRVNISIYLNSSIIIGSLFMLGYSLCYSKNKENEEFFVRFDSFFLTKERESGGVQ
jgi:hypothetical protein